MSGVQTKKQAGDNALKNKSRAGTRIGVRVGANKPKPTRNPKRVVKALVWVVLLSGLFFILLNWGYVVARISFFFFSQNENEVIRPAVTQSQNRNEGAWPKNTLAIPSLGVNVPVIYISETGETAFQKALMNGVVHYPGSSMPGEVGNVYIFGHSSDYAWSKGSYKSAFALLPKIKQSAEIKLTDDKGFAYTYLVKEQRIVGPKDVAVLNQNTGGRRLLTLQTSYPLGTALKRYVVIAELRQSD